MCLTFFFALPNSVTSSFATRVTLEELYNGATKFVEYKRKVLCKTCKGYVTTVTLYSKVPPYHHRSGSKVAGVSSSCRKCRGSGISVTTRQIGPGMLQQMQGVCSDCHGSGECDEHRSVLSHPLVFKALSSRRKIAVRSAKGNK